MKKITLFMLFLYFIFPISVFAYSDYIIASGNNIGIELKSNNLIIVGAYDLGDYNVLRDTDLRLGDKILKVDGIEVDSARSFQDIIASRKSDTIDITYLRNGKEMNSTIKLYSENNEDKTGLYVRDTIRGVATLTYIDKETGLFGALGHEIVEKSTKSRFESDTGTIFYSEVTSITKSEDGNPGEKNARSVSTDVYGTVSENTTSGIFGNYTKTLPNTKLYKVAKPEEIRVGEAKILTVIDGNQVEEFDINIIKINKNSGTKNILFEVTDEKLLNTTGGIVQGMSGSPIIQGDKIVGAVNYVVVDKTNKGYGIFITTMLEEAEN